MKKNILLLFLLLIVILPLNVDALSVDKNNLTIEKYVKFPHNRKKDKEVTCELTFQHNNNPIDPEYTYIAEPLRLCPQGSLISPVVGRGPRALFSARSQEGARDAAFTVIIYSLYTLWNSIFFKRSFQCGPFFKVFIELVMILLLFHVWVYWP